MRTGLVRIAKAEKKKMPSAQNLPVSVAEVWQKPEWQAVTMTYECQNKTKMTNQKISNRKNIQICMKQHLHTQRKKLKDKKRESPLSPGMRESVNLLPKYFWHRPQMGYRTNFLYKDNKKNIWKKRSYESICRAFSQPLLVKVFLPECQLNKIGNFFLFIMMVDLMILYSSLTVSINCSVHVAFVTQLESPAKNLATLKSLGALANSEEFQRQPI